MNTTSFTYIIPTFFPFNSQFLRAASRGSLQTPIPTKYFNWFIFPHYKNAENAKK